jgi:hypothetical protein
MKNKILIIGGIGTLILALLWHFEIITEPLFAIGAAIITLIGFTFAPNSKTEIELKHEGQGDNVLGNKTTTNNYTIIEQEKEREKGNSKISNFSAIDIRKAVDEGPVFQKEEIAKNYKGIRIKWMVVLESINSRAGTIVNLMTLYEGGYPWVNFKVDLADYPTLKVAKKGKELIVTGLILTYKGNSFDIELENIKET